MGIAVAVAVGNVVKIISNTVLISRTRRPYQRLDENVEQDLFGSPSSVVIDSPGQGTPDPLHPAPWTAKSHPGC